MTMCQFLSISTVHPGMAIIFTPRTDMAANTHCAVSLQKAQARRHLLQEAVEPSATPTTTAQASAGDR